MLQNPDVATHSICINTYLYKYMYYLKLLEKFSLERHIHITQPDKPLKTVKARLSQFDLENEKCNVSSLQTLVNYNC